MKTLNKNEIFLMLKELSIDNIHIRIWSEQTLAPEVAHPLRTNRKHTHRKEEFDVIAALIPEPWSWDDIEKDVLGKPFLKDKSQHIGISHSNGFACFAWSSEPFGIDVQTPHDSIFLVRKKYCNPAEFDFLENNIEDQRYLKLWSAKEAIYKFYGQGIDFSHDLIANPFGKEDTTIYFTCHHPLEKSSNFIVYFKDYKHFILTVAKEI